MFSLIFPFATSKRCVLVLGDEAVEVFSSTSGRVRHIEGLPWSFPSFEQKLAQTISRHFGSNPVLIINDMIEQHYRKEKLQGNISFLDKPKVVQRKMNAAFPSYPIRSSIQIKSNKKGKSEEDSYLFAAIPASDQYRRVVAAIKRTQAPLSGFGLLPVESASLLNALSKRLSTGYDEDWVVFIGQHRNGGLRQIVSRNGQLVLTRLTSVVEPETDLNAWITEVVREYQSTVSYLARFGYTPEDNLDVMVVADKKYSEKLEQSLQVSGNLFCMDVNMMANMAKLRIGRQKEPHYADPLHVRWIDKKSSLSMSMMTDELKSLSATRKGASAAILLGLAGVLFLLFMVFMNAQEYFSISSEYDQLKRQEKQVEETYQQKLEEKRSTGVNYALTINGLKAYEDLNADNVYILPVIDRISKALQPNYRVENLSYSKKGTPSVSAAPIIGRGNREVDLIESIAFEMRFPSELNEVEVYEEYEVLMERLENALKGLTVEEVEKSFSGKAYETPLEGALGVEDNKKKKEQREYILKLQVTGFYK